MAAQACKYLAKEIRFRRKISNKQQNLSRVFHLGDWGVDDALVSILLPQTPAHLHKHEDTNCWFFEICQQSGKGGTSTVRFLQTLYAPSYWATSSPSRKTRSSRSSSSSIAWLRASRTVTWREEGRGKRKKKKSMI